MLKSFSENYIQYNTSMNKLDLTNYYYYNEKISDAFVITLDKDTERFEETLSLLAKLNINHIRFPAVYGKTIKQTHNALFNKFSTITNGEIGCALSHFCIYLIASEHQNPNGYTLIMEDDIKLRSPITSQEFHEKINDSLTYDPNVVYIGKCFEKCDNMKHINDDIFYGYHPVCFHSYMIKNAFAKTVVDYITSLNTINKPIDEIIASLLQPQKIIVFHPSLLIQNIKHISNLRNRETQQYNNTECTTSKKIILKHKSIEKFGSNNILIDYVKQYVGNTNNLQLMSYYNSKKSHDNPFIISLPKDTNKYNNTTVILEDIGLNPIKMEAVYGKNLVKTHPEICDLFKSLSYPEIGCFISHIITLYIISKHSNPDGYSIIFEDDITIKSQDPTTIKPKILNSMKYNANMVYLGKCLESCFKITPIENNMFYGYKPLCLHAYMVKNSFAKQVIDYIKSQQLYDLPVDKIILNVVDKKEDIIVFHPSIFYQNSEYESNLRGKIAQQFNFMDCNINSLIIKYILFFVVVCGIFAYLVRHIVLTYF